MESKMGGGGMFGGGCHPRACTRQNSVNRVKKNGNLDNIVIIDLDGDSDVIILDVPESVQEKLLGPHRKGSKVPHHKIIRIDDDDGDEEDEDNDVDHIRFSETGSKNLRSDRASTKRPSSSSVDVNPAGPSTAQEENFTSKVSNCEKPSSSKLPSKNRYGLNDSECSLSDSESDSSDSELLEGSSGKIREQWEKASLRRKHEISKDRPAQGNPASTSGLHTGAHTGVPVDNKDDLYKGKHVESSHRVNDGQSGGENLASTSGLHDRATADVRRENKEAFFKGEPAYSWSAYEKSKTAHSCNVQIDKETQKGSSTRVDCCSSDKANNAANWTEKGGRVNPYPWYFMESRGKRSYYTPACSKVEKQKNVDVPSSDIPQAVSINDESSTSSESQDSGSRDIFYERVVDANDAVSSGEVSCHGNPNKLHEGAFDLNKEEFGTPLNISRDSGSTNNGNGPGSCVKDVALESASCGQSGEVHAETCSLEKADGCLRRPFPKDSEAFVKSAPNIHSEQAGQPNAENGDCIANLQDIIINGREKMKETDEYKQAQEEEWASRQRQLQIQAEEAQKLRKRKKAEVLRLLDMERRQKQRVEEVRQTQKKDEEDMNMKEQLRSEIRNELSRLELTCIDMASLLRGLGIQVGSSLNRPPTSHEVREAYKRALLRFHPDRATRNDIRKQVESEEKFKLISRMKDKFRI